MHLDADLLTAFAEQALSATERDGVLEHLALCGDCREVIALALPLENIATTPIATEEAAVRATVSRAGAPAPHWLSLAWPGLRWAALAAGVAVAGSLLLVHPGKQNVVTLPNSAQQVASSPANPPAALARTDEAQMKMKSELQSPVDSTAGLTTRKTVTPRVPAESAMLLAGNKQDTRPANTPLATAALAAPALDSPSRHMSSETVEVSGATAAVATASSAQDALMARNEAPAIEKAKQPLPGIDGSGGEAKELQKPENAVVSAPAKPQTRDFAYAAKLGSSASKSPAGKSSADKTSAPNITWVITAGVLQRSLNSGQNWQNALRADHPLLSYASHNQDVWAGGQAGILFHSSDAGITWLQVQPSVNAQRLTSDVIHIDLRSDDLRSDDLRGSDLGGDLRSASEIVISTSTKQVWSSTDSGKTWSISER
jgi:hypothetical protein